MRYVKDTQSGFMSIMLSVVPLRIATSVGDWQYTKCRDVVLLLIIVSLCMPSVNSFKVTMSSGNSNHWMMIGAVRLPASYITEIATGKRGQFLMYAEIWLGCGLTFQDQSPVEVD